MTRRPDGAVAALESEPGVVAEFFVDTSAWYPLVVASHPDHATLATAFRAAVGRRRRIVTTNLVVAESHALLRRPAGRRAALTFVRTVGEAPNLVVRSSAELEEAAARDWLERYEDQDFSLTDAVSFAVMAQRGIADALTLDHHFVIAGYRAMGARTT